MNQKDREIHRNNIARLFDYKSRMFRDKVVINTGNSYEHEKAKFDLCWKLAQEGHHFICEATTVDGKSRADIVDLDAGVISEIVNSEGEESLQDKRTRYPLPIEVIICKKG